MAIYLLVRLLFSIYGTVVPLQQLPVLEILIALSVMAMFIASISAVFDDNAKRMLAYSSVAQVGYITLGIGLANVAGLAGGLVHIVNHGVMKACLFLALGGVAYRLGTCRLSEMAGIGRTMPLTMAVFAIAGLGLIGVPGTAGFISKWYLAVGSLEKGWWWMVFLIVASSLIAVVYIGRITEVVWFREPTGAAAEARDPPLSLLVPMFVLAFATIYLGFDTQFTAGMAEAAVRELMGGLR